MAVAIEKRLIYWAVVFLFLFSIILTLSPAVRERSWSVDYRWSHWLGFVVWLLALFVTYREINHRFAGHDPYLLPAAALLSGWGLLTVWRLDSDYGLRQALWLVASSAVLILALRRLKNLQMLRQYKYILLSAGLLLTSLTLLLGTNPAGIGPRLWLGCCGVFFQPSEPLKLLLVIYLAAYLADRHPPLYELPLLLPTLFVIGLALLLLLIQKDLGTASIFILLYSVVLYIAVNRSRVLIVTGVSLVLALVVGYFMVDIIRIRVLGWFNPWSDPSGHSYQIVQSLFAVANGGALGRGPGLGSPGLVPVAISDFIYSSIAEESGLIGSIALIGVFLLIIARGWIAALRATDRFQRLLAAGVTAYLGLQSILIMGGNLRILPLTGVTLPFVSYGGSSLLTSFFALFILLMVGAESDREPAGQVNTIPYFMAVSLLAAGFVAISAATGWWSIVRGPAILARSDNPRRAIADRYVPRGELLDRNNLPINITEGQSGDFQRVYLYPDLSPVLGYSNPVYGLAGLEASLDNYLRGLQGNPASLIWWDQILYGTPPPGLDVRLSLDLSLQSLADRLLGAHPGAIILMQADGGEILVMASHPTFDANVLIENGASLARDPDSPLLNRATQGQYALGSSLEPFILARYGNTTPTEEQLVDLYASMGFFRNPGSELPVGNATQRNEFQDLRVSPLQMALASATLSARGSMPSARIALAVETPHQGWVILPPPGEQVEVFSPSAVELAAGFYAANRISFWQAIGQANDREKVLTWLLTGTLPGWQGTPLVAVVLLEENNASLAESIARELMSTAQTP